MSKRSLQAVHDHSEEFMVALTEQISQVPEVESIFLLKEDASLAVWTVINILDRSVRRRVYEKEAMLLDAFPDVPFDFHVVIREKDESEVISPAGATTLFRRS